MKFIFLFFQISFFLLIYFWILFFFSLLTISLSAEGVKWDIRAFGQGAVQLDTNSRKALNESSSGVYWWACSSTDCLTVIFTWALHSSWSLHVFLQVQSTANWHKFVYCLSQNSHLFFSALNLVMGLEFGSLLEDLSQTAASSLLVPERGPLTKRSNFSLKCECMWNYSKFCNFSILQLIPFPLPTPRFRPCFLFTEIKGPTLTTETTCVSPFPNWHCCSAPGAMIPSQPKFSYSGSSWLGLGKQFCLGLKRHISHVT